MGTPLALIWDLVAEDHASGTFRKVGAEAKGAARETEGLSKTFATMGKYVAVAGIGIAAVSTKMAIDFQESTTKLVTGAGESEEAIAKVRKGILDMAGAVGTGPEALSKGMYLIESAGFHGAHGLDVLKAAAQGAKVGGADLATVADGLTTAMKDYSLPTARAAEITSKLVATVGAGKTTMGDLAGSLAKVLPFSSALGVSLKETLGAMATMTGEGIQAANAATMLKFTMMSLSNETPKGAKALESVGMSAAGVVRELRDKGLQATLESITQTVGEHFPKGSAEYNKAVASIVGGTRGMGAALALTNSHAKTFADNVKTIGGSSADAGGKVKGFSETQKDLKFQIDSIKASVTAYAIELGNVLVPRISETIDFFKEHKTLAKDLGIAIVGLAGFMVAYAAVTKVAAAVTGTYGLAMRLLGTEVVTTTAATEAATVAQGELDVAMDANPIGLVALAVGGLYLAYKHFASGSDTAKDAQKQFAGTMGDVTSQLNAQTGAMTKAARATEAKKLADSGAFTAASKMGIAYADVLSAATGNAAALKRVTAAEKAYADEQSGKGNAAKLEAIKNYAKLTTAIGGSNTAIEKQRVQLSQAQVALNTYGHTNATAEVHVDGVTGAISSVTTLLGLLKGVNNSKISSKSVPGMFDPTHHHATGTMFAPGGWSLVGENGPELRKLNQGDRIVPNNRLRVGSDDTRGPMAPGIENRIAKAITTALANATWRADRNGNMRLSMGGG